MKIEGDRLVLVGFLFLRQRDVAADGDAAGFERAFVGRLHDARTAAGDHAEAIFRQ